MRRLHTRRFLVEVLAPLGVGTSIAVAAGCSELPTIASTSSDVALEAVAEKDLAVVFAAEDAEAPSASTRLSSGGILLSQPTYEAVANAFVSTSVGAALTEESHYEDWRVVSFRIAPCSPLAPAAHTEWRALCWPEVRVVFQPIVRNARIHGRTSLAFADDRAIHALYDAPPDSALEPLQAARARELVARVRAAAKTWRGGPFAPLSTTEFEDFEASRNAVSRALVSRALALRSQTVPAVSYRSVGVRPESATGGVPAREFASRVTELFGEYAESASLRALTAFSLPEGREAAQFDEWVFLSFETRNGALVRQRITMKSAVDGRDLVDLGESPRASQTRDDPRLYAEEIGARELAEIQERAILGPADVVTLTPKIRDVRATLVPNTTCASCHKMNPLKFNFHNLGFLEDRVLSISPRVVSDVADDLAWVNR